MEIEPESIRKILAGYPEHITALEGEKHMRVTNSFEVKKIGRLSYWQDNLLCQRTDGLK